MKKITDEQLWNLEDGLLSDAQKIEIEQEISKNTAIQVRFDNIQSQKMLFSMSEMEKPKPDFAKKLLQNWQVEQQSISLETTTFAANYTPLKMVFAAFGLLSLMLLFFAFSNIGSSEPLGIVLPAFHFPWKSISLSLSVIAAVITVFFIEKLIVFKFRMVG